MAFLGRSLKQRLDGGDARGASGSPRSAEFVVLDGTRERLPAQGAGVLPGDAVPGQRRAPRRSPAPHDVRGAVPQRRRARARRRDRASRCRTPVRVPVERTRIVDPTTFWVTKRVGYERLVLSACHPLYSAAQRIVVFARQVRVEPRRP
jgi:sortase A